MFNSFLDANKYGKTRFSEEIVSTQTQPTKMQRLDQFIQENNLASESIFLKSDTQGFDLEVLKGLGDCIKNIRMIMVELSFKSIYVDMPHATEVMSFLRNHDFSPSGLFVVTRDKKTRELIEMDGVFLNRAFL